MSLGFRSIDFNITDALLSPESNHTTAGARQRSQMNRYALAAVSEWLATEFDLTARVYPSQATLPSIWEVVTGTGIRVGEMRWGLIPTSAIVLDELRIPQEWVDIPAWAADYYIAIQVHPDGHIAIGGYSSYQQVKTLGQLDSSDLTYCLDADDLCPDLNSLLVSWQFHAVESAPYSAIAPLPALSVAQAHSLLERLGTPTILFPRRSIPFAQWAALISHGGWRQQLYERRQGLTPERSLPQWIQSGVTEVAQACGWQRRTFSQVGARSTAYEMVRPLSITGEAYELRIFPVNHVHEGAWRVELRCSSRDRPIPAGTVLRLLTEDLQAMEHNEDRATAERDRLFVDVVPFPGEGIVWETEPPPDDCDREILYF